jgi:small conductance mechanosensitive channel
MGLAFLGFNLTPILALIGGASFVLAFALQNNLDNLASGLLLLVYKPFDVGDEIRISDLWGWVDDINLANTKVRGWQGQLYTIPNSIIISDTITNVTADEQRQGSIIVKTPSDFPDINKVKTILLDIAKFHKSVLQDPAPSVYTLEYDEFSWSFLFGFWTKTEDFWSTWDDLIVMIQERSKQEDVPIAIPTSDIRRIQ